MTTPAAGRHRPSWTDLPAAVRADIETLLGGRVTRARSCAGGFSPGFASRLNLVDGRRVFVKAMDADTWPLEAVPYRTEALVAAALPAVVPAPRLLDTMDDGHWTVLAFEDIDGVPAPQPWDHPSLHRVVRAVGELARAVTPAPIVLPRSHPRLGGWASLASEQVRPFSGWAAANLPQLIRLEEAGLAVAQGESLVHFDLYAHNILLTARRVMFVDWPHARLGAPIVDLVILLSSAAADGIDPEPFLRQYGPDASVGPAAITAVLAANAGFLVAGALSAPVPGLAAITAAKLRLGRGAVGWLERRLTKFGG